MITKDTLVDVWEPGCPYSAGPSMIRKPNAKELEEALGYGKNTWICMESLGCVIIQKDMPYKDVFFWHEKAHCLYAEQHGFCHKKTEKVERFCDDFMLLICGWKRTMTAQLWGLSEYTGAHGAFYLRKRVLAQVGDYRKEFLKMVNYRIKMLEKRLSVRKDKSDMKYEVDAYWLKQLRKLKEEFDKQEKGIK